MTFNIHQSITFDFLFLSSYNSIKLTLFTVNLYKDLTANFFTLLEWHWYSADGGITLSSGPLPLKRDKLNNRTCKKISKWNSPIISNSTQITPTYKHTNWLGNYFSISSSRDYKLIRGFRHKLCTEYVCRMPSLYRMQKCPTIIAPNIKLHKNKALALSGKIWVLENIGERAWKF